MRLVSISIAGVLIAASLVRAQQTGTPAGVIDPDSVEVVQRAPELVVEPKVITETQRTTLNTFSKTFQALAAGHGTRRSFALKKLQDFRSLTNVEARDRILSAKDPTDNKADERFIGDIANYRLVQKYRTIIKNLFDTSKMFPSVGGGPVQFFGHSDIRFASLRGETMMIQSRGTEVFFDSATTDAKTRARNALDELILPSVKDFREAMNADGIDWYAIHLTYGSRDVKKQKASDEVSESVCMAWKKDQGQAYLNGTLSSNQFLKTCVIVHSNRNVISVTTLEIENEASAR